MFILKKGHQPGVYVPLRALFLVFLFLLKNIYCRYSLEPTIYVLSKNMKIVQKVQLKNVIFTAVKNRCILHGRVFVMRRLLQQALYDFFTRQWHLNSLRCSI